MSKRTKLRDANADMYVVLTPNDVACATRQDPSNCAIAQALRRITGSPRVEVHRSIVRVDLPDEHGEFVPTRFRVHKNVQRMIERFDRTGEFPSGALILHKPGIGKTLASRRQYVKDVKEGTRVPVQMPSAGRRRTPDPEIRHFDRARHDW